jgi:hypothetical protein
MRLILLLVEHQVVQFRSILKLSREMDSSHILVEMVHHQMAEEEEVEDLLSGSLSH